MMLEKVLSCHSDVWLYKYDDTSDNLMYIVCLNANYSKSWVGEICMGYVTFSILSALLMLRFYFTAELKDASEMDMSDVQKNLRSLYEYNVMLREKLVATQSMFHSLATKSSSSATESQT